MALNISREKISDGINLTTITDRKFKTNYFSVRFISKLDKKTVSENAIIPNLLITSNSTYKTRTELTKKLSGLYGSNLGTVNHKYSDNQVVGVSASCICDSYALNGEKLTSELIDLLTDCIFHPQIENDGFLAKDFNLRKQELIDGIIAEINDKRTYAIIRANTSIYKDEPSEIPSYGTREGAEALDPVVVYNAYKNLLKTAQIEIMIVSGDEITSEKEKLKQAFLQIERDYASNAFKNSSPVKSEIAEVTENVDVNQCKMVMAFKTSYDKLYVNRLMTAMLGGTAFSKLFTNVREKLSLCYYCAAGFVEGKNVLIVDSGVEKENITKAREEIINQVNALAKGDFEDSELENAVLSISGDFKSNYDTTGELSSWVFIQSLRGDNFTPEQAIDTLSKITRKEVIEAASALKLDTVYVMQGNDKEDEE